MPNDVPNSTYSQVDASNTAAVPNGAPEGWFPSDVNNWGRQVMGALKRFWVHLNPTATTAGTSAAYTLTYAVAPQQLWPDEIFSFKVHATCGAAPTLNINALSAKNLRRWDGAAWVNLGAGDVLAGQVVAAFYNSAGSGTYDVVYGVGAPTGPAGGDLSGSYPNPTVPAKVPTGARMGFTGVASALPGGWVFGLGLTIGNASSNATERANADTRSLFDLYWDRSDLAIYSSSGSATTRGANKTDDWNANKAIATPNYGGRFPLGTNGTYPQGATGGATTGSFSFSVVSGDAFDGTPVFAVGGSGVATGFDHNHTVSGTTNPGSIMPPWLSEIQIIKL